MMYKMNEEMRTNVTVEMMDVLNWAGLEAIVNDGKIIEWQTEEGSE